jgi:hypothetical protein
MAGVLNQAAAGRLDEIGQLLAEQGAGHFRVQAYHRAAETLRGLPGPVAEVYAREGIEGLERLPGIGPSIARSLRDLLLHGRIAMLERLRGRHDPLALFRSVPGIGRKLALTLHDELGLESLAELEAAANDGRLQNLAGLGPKRLAGIRDSLAHRLSRVRSPHHAAELLPPVAELLEVDLEYRRAVATDRLKKIAPRRFNPGRETWLPVLHTSRGPRSYSVLFSNTARAHALGKTRDWVILYFDSADGEAQATVVTAQFGPLSGRRIVRGRERECLHYYGRRGGIAGPDTKGAAPWARPLPEILAPAHGPLDAKA